MEETPTSQASRTIELSSIEGTHPRHKMAQLMGAHSQDFSTSEADSAQPESLQEAIVELYLSVKIRREGEELDESVLNEERDRLRDTDSFVVLEYIRNSFDILVNLKMEETKGKFISSLGGSRRSNDLSAKTAIESQFCSEVDNNDYE
jgi:hypothetical protein